MQLLHKSKRIKLENNEAGIMTIFEHINESIEDGTLVFSHLVVDGVDVYENHEAYLSEQINEIMKVEIITREMKAMIWDTMTSVNEYLERAIPALKQLRDEGFTNELWLEIDHLGEGMQWMLQFVEITKEAVEQPLNWKAVEKAIKDCEAGFAKLLGAVEVKDPILISHMLSKEVTPAYEELQASIELSLEDKGFLKPTN